MATTPKQQPWGAEPDSALTPRSVPTGDMGVILAAMDGLGAAVLRIESRLTEQGERIAAACARMESVATRSDVSQIVDVHRAQCVKAQVNLTTYAKSVGIILAAVGTLVGAIAAAIVISN
jgi:hypothetical protein